ncbi:MAG TPA: lysophospholipid acyltransferase family protein [Oligoflexus sp.]|uniref:lysophospholipid acyltransferase family protein n=1 Tax=Oligoflexus sp. TaxID=1971216 RepID=UPI002D7E7520|nr:lysophospholipid acyltransferase family protein [Oligoflexus sp.]HET9236959.1 lysophospholipid acyltransferase family protein [Oligoflexus sp.]
MLKTMRALVRLVMLGCVILSLLSIVMLLGAFQGQRTIRRKKLVAAVMQAHLRAMSRCAGLEVQVLGTRPLDDRPFLLLSNHVSYWDILALGSLFPLGFMAKDCIESWPVLGTVTRLCNTVFVNRENVRDRVRALRRLQTQIHDLSYCVFPEGTTTAEIAPRLELWCRGNIAVLREPGAPVWLAGLHYEKHAEEAWIDDDELLPHLFRRLKEPSIRLTIYLEPLQVNRAASLSEAAREAWEGTVGLCQKAQYDGDTSVSTQPVRLCVVKDSAAS